MPWIEDDELKDAVTGSIGLTASTDAAVNWDRIIPRANRWAYQLIRTVLAGRGFSPAQIDAVQDRVELNEQIGIDFALALGRKADDDGGETVAEVRARWVDALNLVTIATDDEQVNPPDANSDVGFGYEDTTGDTFTRDSVL